MVALGMKTLNPQHVSLVNGDSGKRMINIKPLKDGPMTRLQLVHTITYPNLGGGMWSLLDAVNNQNDKPFKPNELGVVIVAENNFEPPSSIHVVHIGSVTEDKLVGVSGLAAIDFIDSDFRELKPIGGDGVAGGMDASTNAYGAIVEKISAAGGSDAYNARKNEVAKAKK